MAHGADAVELFDIEVDELARFFACITPDRFGRLQGTNITRRRYPDNEQKNRDAQFAPKNRKKPKPRGWPAYTSSAHRKGQKPSPATG